MRALLRRRRPPRPLFRRNRDLKRLNPWLILIFVVALYLVFSNVPGAARGSVNYDTFKSLLAQGQVQQVVIQDGSATVDLKSKQSVPVQVGGASRNVSIDTFKVELPNNTATPDTELQSLLSKEHVSVRYARPSDWLNIIATFLPIVLVFGMMYFFFMRAQGGQNGVMQFGQSRAKRYGKENRVPTKFTDVAGHDEAKKELVEVVDFLKNPGKYHQIGAEIPKGVLLVGPPGTGKTLLARAVAGEADVPFFSVSASEFMEMFVGVGASRVRTLFEDARKNGPAIIFIDEIDSIGRKRGAGIGGGHDEREQTLNQILSEMDGFDKTSSVIVLAATNRPDVLDPALLRPGRFDRQVTIDLPNLKEREAILQVHLRNKPLGNVDVPEIAKSTPYFSGADLKNVVNESALEAARVGKTQIDMPDFYRALDKITLGLENSSLTVSEAEKKAIAYHEAGHAVTAAVIPGSDKLQKVSIIPRGRALGAAFYLPEENVLMSKERLENQLVVALGGRAAEEVFMGSVTSGAADDFRKSTNIARRMVLEWGMGENFKNMALQTDGGGPVFLGEDMGRPKAFSEHTAQLVDEDVKRILSVAYERSKALVSEYSAAMHEVANALLTQELITGDVVRGAVARVREQNLLNSLAKN